MITNPLKAGPWLLSELPHVSANGRTVFSCFCCGGGSTMGYKLAGYDVLGGVEIDPAIAEIYVKNHNPDYMFRMAIQEFNKLPDSEIPRELFELDILDGSPPCSSFSMAGAREKKWGKAKKFREGQSKQILDDLFFHFIETAKRLQPKVVVAENVKGLIQGNARGYVKQIFTAFKEAGYDVQLFLLNASKMGVPQRRERTFFIANRIGKRIELEFNEDEITVKKCFSKIETYKPERTLSKESYRIWGNLKPGDRFSVYKKGSRFNDWVLNFNESCSTITANGTICHPLEPRHLTNKEYCILQSFPQDFNFMKNKAQYICGMSVPPFMAQRVADQIYKQLLYNG